MKQTLIASAVMMAFAGAATAGEVPQTGLAINASTDMTGLDPAKGEYEGKSTAVYFEGQVWEMTAADLVVKGNHRGFGIYSDVSKPTKLTVGTENTNSITIDINATNSKSGNVIGICLLRDPATGPAPYSEFKGKNLIIKVDNQGEGDARGIHVGSNTTTAKEFATLVINNENTVIHVTGNGETDGIVAMSQGRVEVNGNLEVTADKALLARGDAVIDINKKGDKTVKLTGDIDFNYDKNTSGTKADAVVKVNLSGADSFWIGNATTSYGSGVPPDGYDTVNGLTLNMSNGAQWTPTVVVPSAGETAGEKSVPVNNMELKGGVINVTGNDVDVTIQNLTGTGGTVNLATDLTAADGQQTGSVTIGKAAEQSTLDVKLLDKNMEKPLTSDELTADQAKDLMTNVGGKDTAGNDVVKVTTTVEEGMYNEGFTIDDEAKVHSTGPNSVMQSTLELAAVAPLALNRILTNDVHKRMGDIRSMKQTSGAWARYDGGKLSGESGLENDFHTIQVGVDTVPAADAPRFGVAFSYTTSDAEYKRGDAGMDVYSLAAYGLWMGENGQFVDVVARLGSAKTDMTVDGGKKGSMDNIMTALSGEFGWRFDLTKSLYLEPQVELAYTHVDADDLVLSDGSNYRFDDADSLIGRAGFALGFQCPETGNSAYVRVSAVHEFMGDAGVTGGNGAVYEIDGKDTWVEYGLGANFNLTDSTYLWADVERTSGGCLDEDWRATVGVRYAF